MKSFTTFVCFSIILVWCSAQPVEAQSKADFIQAAKSANASKIEDLLKKGMDINIADDNGKTALFWSSSLGHDNVVEILLKHGADANLRDRTGLTPLMEAAKEGRNSIIKLLLSNREVVKIDYRDLSSLVTAGKAANAQTKPGTIELDARDKKGNTPLILAASAGRVKAVEELLRSGASVQIRNTAGLTAIDAAEINKNQEVVKVINDLLQTGNANLKLAELLDSGNLEELKKLIHNADGANLPDQHGVTPLMRAAERNAAPAAIYLLEIGALPNARDAQGNSVLMYAVKSGAKDVSVILLNFGADPEAKNNESKSALELANEKAIPEIIDILKNHYVYGDKMVQAAHANNNSELDRFLGLGAAINHQDSAGNTALISGASANNKAAVEKLLKLKADPNLRNKESETALMAAARECSADMIKMLLAVGADPTLKDNMGTSALKLSFDQKLDGHERCSAAFDVLKAYLDEKSPSYRLVQAAETGNVKLVQELINKGADPDFEDEFDITALTAASKEGHVEVVKVLVAAGASTTGSMIAAAESGKLDVVKLLIEKNAELSGALSAAASAGNIEIMKLLLANKAEVDESYSDETNYLANPLILAATAGHLEAVKLLLEKGADANITDSEGKTAFDIANSSGHKEVAELLKSTGTTKIGSKPEDEKGRK